MSRAATLPPSPAISWAVARPTPDAAPVTTATRPPNRPPSAIGASVCDDPSAFQARETRHRRELPELALDVTAGGLDGELGGAGLFHGCHAVGKVLRCPRERHRRDQAAGDERPVALVDFAHVPLVDGEMPGALGNFFDPRPPLLTTRQ